MVNAGDYVFKCSKCGAYINPEYCSPLSHEGQWLWSFLGNVKLVDDMIEDGTFTQKEGDDIKIEWKKDLDEHVLCSTCELDRKLKEERHRENYYRQHPEKRPRHDDTPDDRHDDNYDDMCWWNNIVACL
jgi:hypothetical protein